MRNQDVQLGDLWETWIGKSRFIVMPVKKRDEREMYGSVWLCLEVSDDNVARLVEWGLPRWPPDKAELICRANQ